MQIVAIELIGNNLHIGRHIIPLQTRSKTFALVEALLEEGYDAVDKERLRRRVYDSCESVSERLRMSQDCSLNKLISRSRNFLRSCLKGSEFAQQVQWFVYCGRRKKWALYQIGCPTGSDPERDEPK